MILRFVLFLLLNFGALAIGGIFTGTGVTSDWYNSLNQAPWTPPGWVFGVAWTALMICFSIYLTCLWPDLKNKNQLLVMYLLQWVLNVLWNPVFFYFHQVSLGLIILISLTLLMLTFLFRFWPLLKRTSFFLLPYVIWLFIATSLNAYIWVNN